MTKRNITLTSILLLVLVIIIGFIIINAKPKVLGEAGLGLRTASVTLATYRGRLSLLGKQALAVDSQGVNSLKVKGLNVDAVELPGASLNFLNT